MPLNSYGSSRSLDVVYRERETDRAAVAMLETGKLPGRYRNSGTNARAVPTSSSDVLNGDAEGDALYDSSYLYLCLNVSGSLTWCRITLASSW